MVTIRDATHLTVLCTIPESPEQRELGKERWMGECSHMQANSTGPISGHGSHFSTFRGPMSLDYIIPTLCCRKKQWKVLITRMQKSKVDQWDRICIRFIDDCSCRALLTWRGQQWRGEAKSRRGDSKSAVTSTWEPPWLHLPPQMPRRPKPQRGKEMKAANPSAENSAPQAEQVEIMVTTPSSFSVQELSFL